MDEKKELSERLLDFAACCINLTARLNRTAAGKHITIQLMRSATSSGANYEEACGAESRADFIHKLQIVLKELRESSYWLRLVHKVDASYTNNLQPLLNESQELTKIIAKSVVTAKSGKSK